MEEQISNHCLNDYLRPAKVEYWNHRYDSGFQWQRQGMDNKEESTKKKVEQQFQAWSEQTISQQTKR